VHSPIRYQRRRGRKRIVAPDGTEIISTNRPEPEGWSQRWREHCDGRALLDAGVYASVAELEAEALAGMFAPQGQISRK
jgi:hypothetical protein